MLTDSEFHTVGAATEKERDAIVVEAGVQAIIKISGFLAAIKLTDKSGYPDNGYPDLQTLVTTVLRVQQIRLELQMSSNSQLKHINWVISTSSRY